MTVFSATSALGNLTLESLNLIQSAASLRVANPVEAAFLLNKSAGLQDQVRGASKTDFRAQVREIEAAKNLALENLKPAEHLEGREKEVYERRRVKIVGDRFDREAKSVEQIRTQIDALDRRFASGFYPVLEDAPSRVLVPGRVGYDGDAAYFESGYPPRVYDSRFASAFTFLKNGEVLPEDLAVIIMMHGAGATHSNSNAVIPLMNDLSRMEINGSKKRLFATVAYDHPFHGFGARDPGLKNIDRYMEYLHAVVQYYAGYGKPVFLFGRSFGAVSAVEYASRYDDVAGVIHMSGLHPDWVEENIANMHANNFGINVDGLDFAVTIMRQLTYFDAAAPLAVGGLILAGLRDVEYDPEKQQTLWPALGDRLGFGVRIYENGEHNLLNPANALVHKLVRSEIHDFILDKIKRR